MLKVVDERWTADGPRPRRSTTRSARGVQPATALLAAEVGIAVLNVAAQGRLAADVAADLDHLGVHLGWPAAAADVDGAAADIGRYLDRVAGRELLLVLDDDGRIAGGTALISHEPRAAAIELGCWVDRGHEGRGDVRAACLATLAHACAALHAHRVAWMSATDNARSRALAERLGFRHEGVLRHAALHDGRRQDLDVLSMVDDEIDAALAVG